MCAVKPVTSFLHIHPPWMYVAEINWLPFDFLDLGVLFLPKEGGGQRSVKKLSLGKCLLDVMSTPLSWTF